MFDNLKPEQLADILFRLRVVYWICAGVATVVLWGFIGSIGYTIYLCLKKKNKEVCDGEGNDI